MPRWLAASLLMLGLVALADFAFAQTGAVDKVTFRDRTDGKVTSMDGDLKETPAGVSLLVNGKVTKTIASSDVIRVDPGQLVGVTRAEQLAAMSAEDGKEPAKARDTFAGLLVKAGPAAPERTRRYLMFREAVWAVKFADTKTGDDFKAEAKKAADKMTTVVLASKKSWEVWPASRTVARIHMELGAFDKCAATLAGLAVTPDLSPELRLEARLAEAAALLRGKQSVDGLLDQIAKDKDFPASGALTERLAVLREVAKLPAPAGATKAPEQLAKLSAAVDAAKDPVAKAVGYNFLGDAFAARTLLRDAMWAYLWADMVYNQDTDERVYAVNRVIEVFEKLGDKDRATQFRDRLPQVR